MYAIRHLLREMRRAYGRWIRTETYFQESNMPYLVPQRIREGRENAEEDIWALVADIVAELIREDERVRKAIEEVLDERVGEEENPSASGYRD